MKNDIRQPLTVNRRLSTLSLPLIAWRNFCHKIFRNLILMVAVAMLASLLTFAVLFNSAVTDDIRNTTGRLGADIVLVPIDAMDRAEEFILESRKKTFYMDGGIIEKLRRIKGVAAITPQVYLKTLSSGCCSIAEGQVVAFDPESDFVVRSWMDKPPKIESGEVYVGSYVYEYLGLIDTPSLFGRKVKVRGHLAPTGTGLDHGIFMRMDDLTLISPAARGKYRPGQVSIIFVKTAKGADVEAVARAIQSTFFTVGTLTRGAIGSGLLATLADIMRIFTVTILISSTLAVLLAWSTFTAMTNERRREIGIFRALGARQSHVIRLFLTEAAIIGVTGGASGVIAGFLLTWSLAGSFNILSNLGITSTSPATGVTAAAIAFVTGIVVCLSGSLLPVIKLAGLDPFLAIQDD